MVGRRVSLQSNAWVQPSPPPPAIHTHDEPNPNTCRKTSARKGVYISLLTAYRAFFVLSWYSEWWVDRYLLEYLPATIQAGMCAVILMDMRLRWVLLRCRVSTLSLRLSSSRATCVAQHRPQSRCGATPVLLLLQYCSRWMLLAPRRQLPCALMSLFDACRSYDSATNTALPSSRRTAQHSQSSCVRWMTIVEQTRRVRSRNVGGNGVRFAVLSDPRPENPPPRPAGTCFHPLYLLVLLLRVSYEKTRTTCAPPMKYMQAIPPERRHSLKHPTSPNPPLSLSSQSLATSAARRKPGRFHGTDLCRQDAAAAPRSGGRELAKTAPLGRPLTYSRTTSDGSGLALRTSTAPLSRSRPRSRK